VERARSGDEDAWSELLPPGWLERDRADVGRTRAGGPPPGAEPARRFRPLPPKIAVAVAMFGMLATLIANSAVQLPAREGQPLRPTVRPPSASGPALTTDPSESAGPATPVPKRPDNGAPPAVAGYVGPASPRWGYVWMDQATAARGVEAGLDPAWQWTSGRSDYATAGRRATVVHRGTGAYTVRLPGAGYPAGTAHVTSFATVSRHYYAPRVDGHSCAVAGYQPSGADELVDVRCHGRDGTPVDVQFNVFFSAPNRGSEPYAAVRYDAPGGAGTVSPIANSGTWNSTAGRNHVHQLAIGRWRAVLSGTALASGGGYVHVTAYGTGAPARCRPESTAPAAGGAGLEVIISCHAITVGATQPVNSQWTLTYTDGAGLHHAPVAAAYATTTGDPASPGVDGRHSWASNGEVPRLARLGAGSYRLTYDRLGKPDDAPVVTAVGTLPRHCRLFWWDSYSAPPRVSVDIYCYDTAGNRADALFAVAYLRGP